MDWWQARHSVSNGEAARVARVEAVDELIEAHERTHKVDATVRHARAVSDRAERFAMEAERALHLRGGAT